MPPMAAMGTNTAESTKAMPITGAVTSSIAFAGCFLGRQSMFDVMLDCLDDDNGVIHDEADRENQTKQRERVDRKTKHRKDRKGADERDGHGKQRDKGRAPILQEEEYNNDDQDRSLPQGSSRSPSFLP